MLTLAGRRKRVNKSRLSHQDIRRALIPARFLCGSRRKRLRGYIYSTPWILVQCFVYEATMGSVTKNLLNIENFTKFTCILHSTIIFFFRQIKAFDFQRGSRVGNVRPHSGSIAMIVSKMQLHYI